MKKMRLVAATLALMTALTFPTYAAEWKQDNVGWWYQNDDGSYPTNKWQEINGVQYYFGNDGYMLHDATTPDGCSVGTDGARIKKKGEVPSATALLNELKAKNSNLTGIDAFDSSTDPNGKLGRPGYYISKADFSDARVAQVGQYLCGGTLETFATEEDCKKRTDYLNSMNDPSFGFLALNQYVYSYKKVLFRVEYDLSPEQAEEYHQQMNTIMNGYE